MKFSHEIKKILKSDLKMVMKKMAIIILRILQFFCFSFFLFYLLMALGSSHEIPFQTYFKIGIVGLLSIVLYLSANYMKRRK